jgi:AAA+ superfamily predicted ATPase
VAAWVWVGFAGTKFDKEKEKTTINGKENMRARIINYIRAGYSGLYLVSPEEKRVEAELQSVAKEIKFHLHVWSVTEGVLDTETGTVREMGEPLEALIAARGLPEQSILVLRDFHAFLAGDPNPVLIRAFKDALQEAKTKSKTFIVLGCRLCLPPELERELAVIEYALPGKAELVRVLEGVIASARENKVRLPDLGPEAVETLVGAAGGLTTIEAENAFALSVVEAKGILPEIVAREKAQAIKKNGLLEIIETKETLESVGGLDTLKSWLLKRKDAFGERARKYGLPIPKGLLMVGIPGSGKSLAAKATAKVFGVPLLKLDAGRIFAGLVGQSEGNLRSVIQTAEAIAPCVLWLDEIEKGMAGSKSSGSTDGGTSARVLGTFLSWMQEKTAPVFVVATANDVTQLPPEMLRKGRWDELFFVDLPSQAEREAIWKIQIARHGRKPKDFDTAQLARATDGLTGSEIEAVFVEALYQAFDEGEEPTDLAIAGVLADFVPLSKTMAEQIAGLRNWAKGRARPAATVAAEPKLRRLAA